MAASSPLYVHIGLMKTGTSFLQSTYFASTAHLEAAGLALVPPTKRGMFHLMLDVRDRYRPQADPPAVAHALERFPGQLAAAPGDRALLSQESLSSATTEQVARLAAAVGERELHVVLTVRDVARQIPSAWQQELQSGHAVGFEEFLEGVLARRRGPAAGFWKYQDVLAVVDRWATAVPPERIHVVTVPPSGGPPGLLLERFSGLLGVPVDGLREDAARRNTSIGRVQGEVLRRVNASLPAEKRRRHLYGDVGKRFFAAGVLGPQRGERALVPRAHEAWCREYAESVVAGIRERGLHVVGDLEDLRPLDASFGPDLAPVSEAEVAASATAAITTMLEQRMDALAESRQQAAAAPDAPGGRRARGRYAALVGKITLRSRRRRPRPY